MKLKELRAKLARLKELRKKETLTDAEKEERSNLPGQIETLNTEYEEEKREAELLAKLDTSFEEPPAGNVDPEKRSGAEVGDKPIYGSFGAQLQDVIVAGGGEVRGITRREAGERLAKNDQRNIDRAKDPELRADMQSIKDASTGGGMVQSDFAFEVVEKGFNNGVIVNKCSQRNLTSGANSMDIYGLDEASRKDGSRYGGIKVFSTREAEKYIETKAKFAKVGMKVDKITGLLYLTDEMIADAGFVEGEVRGLFPKAFAFKVQDLVLNGRGSGEPLGIHKSEAMIEIAKESGQAVKSIVDANISKMKAVIAGGGAEFYANRDIIPALDSLYRTVEDQKLKPLFKQTSIDTGLLDGIPITFIEQAETLGTAGDLVLADFAEYVILRKGGMTEAESLHFKFDMGLKAIRWEIRLDGQSRWKEPLTPYKGTNKLSPFVRLAKRA